MATTIYVRNTRNAKVGAGCDCTYLPLSTCSRLCGFRGRGCYAESGRVGLITARLRDSKEVTALHQAQAEARLIREHSDSEAKYLRLHVSGDFKTRACAEAVNKALVGTRKQVWSYTHSWRVIPRSSCSNISMLASANTIVEANEALALGYAPAIVVGELRAKNFVVPGSKIKFLACPAQWRGITCVECRLCMDADTLTRRGLGIAFAGHGQSKKRLAVIS